MVNRLTIRKNLKTKNSRTLIHIMFYSVYDCICAYGATLLYVHFIQDFFNTLPDMLALDLIFQIQCKNYLKSNI